MSSLALAAFISGLLGSMHCVAMCGGVLSALNLSRPGQREVIRIHSSGSASIGFDRNFSAAVALQISYSVGRIGSYAVAGALAGGLAGVMLRASVLLPLQTALGIVANVMIILLGLHIAGHDRLLSQLERVGKPLWRRLAPHAKFLLPADTPARAVASGALWGWLPCALVYGMLPLALSSGNALDGALIMMAFGLGTLPAILAAGLLIDRLRGALANRKLRNAAAGLMIGLGLWGLARIPHVQEAIRQGLLCLS
ncbi:MAG TPA: sulfite exporter TauE/SafE family protein [Burkholderiales bacterium]|nr:sulfite exporter TauE/SafE family protein [Burkholderiales bacterium]